MSAVSKEKRPVAEITDEGVALYGRQLGHEPCLLDVLNAVPYEPSRRLFKMNCTREILVFDEAGLVVLVEIKPSLVYNISFRFEGPDWRKEKDEDPAVFFNLPMRVGNVYFTPPIRSSVADKASQQCLRDLTFFFTNQGNGVASLNVGFPLNELKVDPSLAPVIERMKSRPTR